MKKTYVYTDELHDDFAATKDLKSDVIPEDFCYLHRSPWWNLAAFAAYRLFATPLAWLYCKLFFGLRIKGKAHLRGLKQGYFLYANHTQHTCDAFIPTIVAFPRRAHIVTAASAVSIPGIRTLVQMLGAIPLPPTTARGFSSFTDALQTRIGQGRAVCLYPEAHIWPYYTHIRPYRAGVFAYPVRCGVPAVPYTVTYRERRLFKRLHPNITVYIGAPIYPNPEENERRERQRLRDDAYAFMTETAEGIKQPEFVRYVRADASE